MKLRISILALALVSMFAFSSDWTFSLEPFLGNRFGSAGEHLFNLNGYGKDVDYAPDGSRQISRLDWDILPLYVIGNKLSLGYYKGLQIRNSLEFGLPLACGHMQDYDWATTAGHQTHYSFHENKITGYFAFSLDMGWKFSFVDGKISVTPLAGMDFSVISFEAKDGYKQYVPATDRDTTPWSDDIERVAMAGKVITYEQERYLLRLGLETVFCLHPKFTLLLDLFVSPVLSINSFDSHLRTGMDYLDHNMKGTVVFEGSIGCKFNVFNGHSIVLRVNGNFQPVATGESYLKNAEDDKYSKDSSSLGGASQWDVGFFFGWCWQIL